MNWLRIVIVLALALAAKYAAPKIFGNSSDLIGWIAAAIMLFVAAIAFFIRRRSRPTG